MVAPECDCCEKSSDDVVKVCSHRFDTHVVCRSHPSFWKREGTELRRSVTFSDIRNGLNSFDRVPIESILKATRIYDLAKETPLDFAKCLSESTGNSVWLKREDMQPVFSFKIRGAYNKMAGLTEEELSRGVVTCSAGNHAQGVAYSARHLGTTAKIFMPVITPTLKADAVKRMGAEVVFTGATFDEAAAKARECAAREGRILVHPFDDLEVIAGQGVIGLELLKQHRAPLDAVFVPVGGGGMTAGIGSALKAMSPSTKIIGVEGMECPGMSESLKAGRVVTLDCVGTFADGAAVKTVGAHTFHICYRGDVIDETVLVNTDEICAAIKDGFNDVRVVLEPAGALAIAGMKKYIHQYGCRGYSFAAILSGANTDFDRLRFISSRADTTEHLMAVLFSEKTGMFRKLCDLVQPRCVTEFSYRIMQTPSRDETGRRGSCDSCGDYGQAQVLMSYRSLPGIPDLEDYETVKKLLEAEGMEVVDLQKCELSKVHGRHLVGGRSDAARNEVLCRFEYAERPGSLQSFLSSLPELWNVSLFHYRNHGADVGRIVAGLQVPQENRHEFESFLNKLKDQGYRCFVESDNVFYKTFLKHRHYCCN